MKCHDRTYIVKKQLLCQKYDQAFNDVASIFVKHCESENNSFSHLELTNSYCLFRSQSFVLDYKPFLISLYTLNWQLMSVLFVSSHAPCSADFSLWVFNSVNFGSIPSSSIFCLFLLQFRAYSFLFNLGPFLSWSNKGLFLPYITWKCPYRHIRISTIFSPDKLQFNTWVGNEILNQMAIHEKPYTGK